MSLNRVIEIGLALILLNTLCLGAMAQSSCTTALVSLSPCLNYITGNSSSPSSSCCSQLAGVVGSQPLCLCSVLNGGASSLGFNINQTQALALPGACKVQTLSVSRCNGKFSAGAPTTSPAEETPASPAKPTTPSVPDIPSESGSKTVPSTPVDSSDAVSIKLFLSPFFFLQFFASFASVLSAF
ncbi:non-specific lipid transfer protein GPI-anchored 5-like [Aristolochia californica]|uniref:non-specific lipid transfer protein GPI-anchored 5-like n=1 Tax=Aristolochia californica TaxID=171875 RepID=UPI0035E27EA0